MTMQWTSAATAAVVAITDRPQPVSILPGKQKGLWYATVGIAKHGLRPIIQKMVKTKNKQMNKKKKMVARPKSRPLQVARNIRLDQAATAYARLLADPCGAPLTHPIYMGSEGGILVKAESVFTLIPTTGSFALLHWTPGAVGTNNVDLIVGESSTVTFAAPAVSNNGPGNQFLKDNATGCRCVAGCMQVTYLGTELNRAGTITMGRTQGSLIDVGTSVTASQIEPALEHFSRTPDYTSELRWMPANMDQSFTDPNVVTAAQEKDRKSAITMVAGSITAAAGIRVRLVAIYEYQPRVGLGISTPSSSRASSSYTLDDV